MKIINFILAASLVPVSAFAKSTYVLKDAVYSCIRILEENQNYHDAKTEIFFWKESDQKLAQSLVMADYKLKNGIESATICGEYTPVIVIQKNNLHLTDHFESRRIIKKIINAYKPTIDEGPDKIITQSLIFIKN